MARAIVYCDLCRKIIPPSGLDRDHAIVGETSGICQECVGKLTPEQREVARRRFGGGAALTAPEPAAPGRPRASTRQIRRISARAAGAAPVDRAAPGALSGAGRAPGSVRQARPSRRLEVPLDKTEAGEAPPSRRGLVIAGLAAGLLVGLAVAFLFGSESSEDPDRGDKDKTAAGKDGDEPKRPPPKRDAPPVKLTPAQKRFAKIKKILDPSFRNYEEGRRILREFLAKYPDEPAAEEAKALLAKMGGDLLKAAEAEFAETAKRTEQLAGWHRADEAKRILEAFRGRSADGEWYKAGGKAKIESALVKVEEVRVSSAKAALERARAAVGAGKLKQARRILGPHGRWPRDVRDAAETVLREIVALEARAEKLRDRDVKWSAFVLALHRAGKKGVREASEVAAREGAAMREVGFGDKLARMDALIREAKLVEELAAVGLVASTRTLRLQLEDRRVAGKVLGVTDGVIRIKPLHGPAVDVPLLEIGVANIMEAAGIVRKEKGDPLKAAAYLAIRGDIAAARKKIADVTDDKARALAADIDEFARVIVPPRITSAAPSEAGKGNYYSHTFAASGTEPVRFALDDAAALPAGLSWNAATATISGTPGAAGSSPEITLTAANGIAPDATLAFTITVSDRRIVAEGKILREWWTGIPGGAVSDLTSHADYPDKPAGSDFLTEFYKGKWGDNYGQRIRGYLHPPVSGDYTFTKQSDDGSELWLSTDEDPANKVQKRNNATVALVTGRRYYIEAVHKEHAAGDYVRIGWKRPDAVQDNPIPGRYLSPWHEGAAPAALVKGTAPVAPSGPSVAIGGLVAHWKFDEGEGTAARDSSGKGHDGSIHGAKWITGRIGGALDFDGKSYVEIASGVTKLGEDDYTIAAWIMTGGTGGTILSKSNNNDRWEFREKQFYISRFDNNNNKPIGSAVVVGHGADFISGSEVVNDDSWHHVAVTWDAGARKGMVYVDGAPGVTVSNFNGREDNANDKVRIGWSPRGEGTVNFDGAIDDVRIYDRALSADQVRALSERRATEASETVVKLPGGPKEPLPGETGLPGEWGPGLICEIFKDRYFTERVGVRIAPSLLGDSGGAFPDLGGEPGGFSMRWTGYLLAPVTGRYTFNKPEGFRSFKIDGKKAFGVAGGLKLAKGLHTLEATMRGGPARARTWLQFAAPGGFKDLDALLYHKVPEAGSMGPFAEVVRGLKAEYFKDDSCRRLVSTGTIEDLEFDLQNRAACTLCSKDGFSMRVSGYLLVPEEAEYTFEAEKHGDDSVQVYVHGKLVVNMWEGDAATDTDKLKLSAGFSRLKIRFRNTKGSSRLKLKWQRPKRGMEPIQPHYFFMDAPKPRAVKRTGLAPGVRGYLYRGARPAGRAVAERIDSSLSFDWSGKPPAPGVPKDDFSAVWRGFLVAPESGLYVFRVEHDGGGVQLSVGGRRIVNRLGSTKGNVYSSAARLSVGATVLDLRYGHKKSNKAFVKISWMGPNFHLRPVAGADLAHKGKFTVVEALVEPPAPKPVPGRPKIPGAEPEKPEEPLPKGNLVKNGDFEKRGTAPEIAEGWRKHQWGSGQGAYSVRHDHVNSHGGEGSLTVHTFAEGVHPGARTTLTSALVPGRYELRFWACAAVGKSADVCAHLAGRDVMSATVGEDWKLFKTTVEVKQKQPRASLRLYTTTSKVRVWFDDVEVEAVSPAGGN